MTVECHYETMPGLAGTYARAVARLSDHWPGLDSVTAISAHVEGLKVQQQRLNRYRQLCAFTQTDTLPLTYPHVWALPMQMAVLTHRQFPLKLLGLVHVSNEITQHRTIAADETLSLDVRVDGWREVRSGVEFDLITEYSDASEAVVWTEVATMLSRRKTGKRGERGKRVQDARKSGYDHEVQWAIPANIGRRYAVVSGDYNPIHLSALTARLFGFRQAIATGMWLNGRVAAELTRHLESSAYAFRIVFRRPVFLPATVRMAFSVRARGAECVLMDRQGASVHLQGQVRYF